MSDFKSKLPDFKELTSMTSKLYKGIKSSVQEIIQDYKDKRAETETKPTEENKASSKPEEKTTTSPSSPKEKSEEKPETAAEDKKEDA